jgi:hypothetical protein
MFEEYGYRSYRLQPPLSDHSRLAADASFERHDVGSLLTGCDRGSMRSGVWGWTPARCHTYSPQIDVVMILPQVHLRKPCYDFTFL